MNLLLAREVLISSVLAFLPDICVFVCVCVVVRARLVNSDGDRNELIHARFEFRLEYDVVSIRK
jgi:hypothetical protein